MVYYKPVKVIINALGFAKVIINMIVSYHSFLDSIVTDWGSFFNSKFWLLLCYLLGIKRRLSIAFHPQTEGQIERQNSTIEAYLLAFINFEQNNLARLLSLAEFAYNNVKNASTNYMSFELNCKYHPWAAYKKDFNLDL